TTGRDSRPGGGLGPPIDAPDPLEKYRWYILGGFGVVLAAGAIFVMGRSRTTVPQFASAEIDVVDLPATARPPAANRSALLLDALKEELFQLEVEHKQGKISQAEYEKAKAALDQTLERALKRGRPASSPVA
ncbi:MAG: carboxypeptidase regulatory-like domain-containing protein, partial [Terriglobales bacterium]